MYSFIYETSFGKLQIVADAEYIKEIHLKIIKKNNYENKETGLIKKAHKELIEYFEGKRKKFTLPLNPDGTEFQKRVWKALEGIPYGETRSYKEVAIAVGNSKACRAVGNANNKNPIVIVIPCHRVIGSNKELVGYGIGLDIKRKLLELEKSNKY